MARKLDVRQDPVITIPGKAYAAVTGISTAARYPGGLFVKWTVADNFKFELAGVGDSPSGVLNANCAVDADASIAVFGPALVTLGGTVANDGYVEVDSAGKAVAATGLRPVAGQVITGGVSGDVVAVLLGKLPDKPIYGTAVASAATIVPTGEVFHVTGTSTITAITSTGILPGAKMTLIFDSTAGITKGATLVLVSSFSANAGNSITLVYDGTAWYESGRLSTVSFTTPNGAQMLEGYVEEEITLSTGGATTDSTANLLPANSEILGVVARVTTTITNSTNWALGEATTAARFLAATTDLTAGTTKVGVVHRQGSISTDATGPMQASAAKLRITTTGSNPGAGKVRVAVFYRQFVAPTA